MKFTIVSTKTCPWCDRAFALIDRMMPNAFIVKEVMTGADDPLFAKISALGCQSVPQVFLEEGGAETHIGGYKELEAWLSARLRITQD